MENCGHYSDYLRNIWSCNAVKSSYWIMAFEWYEILEATLCSAALHERDRDGNVILIIAKVTDDIISSMILMAGKNAMRWLSRQMEKSFYLSKSTIDGTIFYNSSKIHQNNDGAITMDLSTYLKEIPLYRSHQTVGKNMMMTRRKQRCQNTGK